MSKPKKTWKLYLLLDNGQKRLVKKFYREEDARPFVEKRNPDESFLLKGKEYWNYRTVHAEYWRNSVPGGWSTTQYASRTNRRGETLRYY